MTPNGATQGCFRPPQACEKINIMWQGHDCLGTVLHKQHKSGLLQMQNSCIQKLNNSQFIKPNIFRCTIEGLDGV